MIINFARFLYTLEIYQKLWFWVYDITTSLYLHKYLQQKTHFAFITSHIQPIQVVSHGNYHGILHTITW